MLAVMEELFYVYCIPYPYFGYQSVCFLVHFHWKCYVFQSAVCMCQSLPQSSEPKCHSAMTTGRELTVLRCKRVYKKKQSAGFSLLCDQVPVSPHGQTVLVCFGYPRLQFYPHVFLGKLRSSQFSLDFYILPFGSGSTILNIIQILMKILNARPARALTDMSNYPVKYIVN